MIARVGQFLKYQTLPPNLIQSPFSKQTQFKQVLLHTLILSLPSSASIFYSINFNSYTRWNPIITFRSLRMTKTTAVCFVLPHLWCMHYQTDCLVQHWPFYSFSEHLTCTWPSFIPVSLILPSPPFSLKYPKTLWIQVSYTFRFIFRKARTGALEPVPWTLPRHNVLLLLKLLLILHVH